MIHTCTKVWSAWTEVKGSEPAYRIRAILPASIMGRVKFTAYRIRSRVASGAIEMKTPPLSGR